MLVVGGVVFICRFVHLIEGISEGRCRRLQTPHWYFDRQSEQNITFLEMSINIIYWIKLKAKFDSFNYLKFIWFVLHIEEVLIGRIINKTSKIVTNESNYCYNLL